jgi:3D (Asp-Asp-Asp) domain-containing protein
MPVVNSTPTKRSQNSSSEVSPEIAREEWINSFLLKATSGSRWKSLPVVWMIVVSAVVFPIGFWSQMDSVSEADEIPTTQTDSSPNSVAEAAGSTPEATAALPDLPDPTISSPASSETATRIMSVTIIEGGKEHTREIEVADKATVREAINACGFALGELDRLYPDPDSEAYHNQRIRITRVRAETKTRTTSIAPEVRYRPTPALKPGQTKTESAGKAGKVEVSERVWFKDGQVSGREKLGQKIIQAPQDKVIAVGARPYYMPGKIPYHNRYAKAYSLAARAGSPRDRMASNESKSLRRVKSMVLTATGYSPHPSENGGYTVTATGLPISYGAAAVDPRVIPLGTKLYVEGYGYAFACDVGGAIKGKRIDLAYDSYRLANTKGRKKVKVWILAP